MQMFPYIIIFAVICLCLGIGLQRRSPWIWYAGWVFFYLAAGFLGTYFFSALYYAESAAGEGFAFIYLFGGLVLWLPTVLWWATHKSYFRGQAALPKPASSNDATQSNRNA
jgi:hypothetical protein